jgi:hypothetical protein
MVHFIITINEILREKGKKLRLGISTMGMTHTSYWISWFITSIIVTSILTLNLMLIALIF